MAHHLKQSPAPRRRTVAGFSTSGIDTDSTPSLTNDAAPLFADSGARSPRADNTAVTHKPPIDPVLLMPEVLEIVPIGRTTLLKMVKAGTFPAPLHLTTRIRGWRLSAVEKFLASVEGE
jgi:predicted DNA-binding transcriptional regulator AlpA